MQCLCVSVCTCVYMLHSCVNTSVRDGGMQECVQEAVWIRWIGVCVKGSVCESMLVLVRMGGTVNACNMSTHVCGAQCT